MTAPSRRLLGFLPTLGLAAACSFRSAPEWPALLADVRAKYPSVRQLTVEELLAAEADPGPLLLDARATEEFALSHLRDARWTPDESAALAALRDVPREREVVVYCSVGMRSSALAETLAARGYTRVANLEGGIFAWANRGLPTFKTGASGEERAELVHPYDERWGTLLVPERRAGAAGR